MNFQNALLEYHARQKEKGRAKVVILDMLGYKGRARYKPAEDERRPCCLLYTGDPSIFQHLRSAKHIANLYGLDEDGFITYVRVREIARTREMRRV